jgi:hypothetical protein
LIYPEIAGAKLAIETVLCDVKEKDILACEVGNLLLHGSRSSIDSPLKIRPVSTVHLVKLKMESAILSRTIGDWYIATAKKNMETTYRKIQLLQRCQLTLDLFRALCEPNVIINLSMESNALDRLDQLRMMKKLCKCLNTRIADFSIVNRSRCIKEQNIVVEVEKRAESVNEVVLFDEKSTRFLACV